MLQKNTSGYENRISAEDIKKVLIIKGPGIGDVITTIPLARNFKEIIGCEVHVLEEHPPEKQGKFLLKNCPYIDKIIRFDYNIWYILPKSKRVIKEIATLKFIPDFARFVASILKLKKERYDLVFEGFPGTRNTFILTQLINPKFKACCSSHYNSDEYQIVLPIKGKNIVQTENSLFSVALRNPTEPDLSLELCLNSKEIRKRNKADEFLKAVGSNSNLVGITTGHSYKKWQNAKWIELIKSMPNANIMIFGDEGQANDAREIEISCGGSVANFAGKLKLEETIEFMRHLKLFVCTNGGLMWIAAALRIPTVVISGASPYWWDPQSKNVKIVRKAGNEFYKQEKYAKLQSAETSDVSVKDVINAAKDLAKDMSI
jgi:ADP-heptose:LPS heptosyltransferase